MEPKNHHYVPQFLLRNFCDERGDLVCTERRTARSFRSSPRNVASENHFYDLPDGKSLEGALSKVEESIAPIVATLIESLAVRALSHEQRAMLAYYLGLQLLRTRATRNDFYHLSDSLHAKRIDFGIRVGDTPDSPRDGISDPNRLQSLANLRIAEELTPYLLEKIWCIHRSDGLFLIGDNPVARTNQIDESTGDRNLGIASRGSQISFPLSPNVSLVLLCRDSFEEVYRKFISNRKSLERDGLFDTVNLLVSIRRGLPVDSNIEVVDSLNELQVIFSERFFFSRNRPDREIARLKDSVSLREGSVRTRVL